LCRGENSYQFSFSIRPVFAVELGARTIWTSGLARLVSRFVSKVA